MAANGDDVLNGGTGADRMRGGEGADQIEGGDLAADYFDASIQLGFMTRAQADAIIAQLNAGDTATFGPLSAVDVDLERAVQIGGEAEGDTLTGIENLVGTQGADVLRGDDKANVLEGGAGSDTLEGRGGADRIDGGTGIDTASYASSDAAVNVDLIRATQQGGDAQGDTLIGIEKVQGSRFGDRLSGSDGNDIFDGGLGNDFIDGRGGVDTIDLSAWDVGLFAIAGQANVTLRDIGDGIATRSQFVGFQSGGFRVTETDTLRGIENVIGTNIGDTITGNGAANVITGRGGNDTMDGGAGNDTFVLTAKADSLPFSGANFAGDLIRGFEDSASANDVIDFSAIDADEAADGNQAFFFDNGNGVIQKGELVLSSFFDPAQGGRLVSTLLADTNGDGNADIGMRFDRLITTFDAADFIL